MNHKVSFIIKQLYIISLFFNFLLIYTQTHGYEDVSMFFCELL